MAPPPPPPPPPPPTTTLSSTTSPRRRTVTGARAPSRGPTTTPIVLTDSPPADSTHDGVVNSAQHDLPATSAKQQHLTRNALQADDTMLLGHQRQPTVTGTSMPDL